LKYKFLKLLAISGVLAFSFSTQTLPQTDKEIEAIQSLARAQVKFIFIQGLDLSTEEMGVFWPLYDAYRAELSKVGEKSNKLINDYAASYQNMTNEVAEDLTTRFFAGEEEGLGIRIKYRNKMAEVLSPIKVAKFIQIENKLIAIARYQLASQIPLMEEGPEDPNS